ncbi:uncharacterized protein [Palaemon carinicauda]|uniref:uncharacterized protein n=1 Tax=Palaemon carinicauda TaxID=392227 RepID=UPI0035B58DBC
MAHLGNIAAYDKSEDFEDYVERFDQFCLANDITEKDKKRAVFLSAVGAPTYGLLKTLLAPNKPSSRTYQELTELLKNHLHPKPILIAERFKFYDWKQRPGESITDYATEQRKLAETSSLKCYRCGKTNHKADVCFHKDTECNGCHKKGHLRRMCRMENHTTVNRNLKYGRQGRKRLTVNMAEEETSGSEEETTECKLQDELVHTLKYCVKNMKARHNKVPEIIVKVKLNEVPIDMELDTGASVSLISEEFYVKHLKNTVLQSSDIVLKTMTGEI